MYTTNEVDSCVYDADHCVYNYNYDGDCTHIVLVIFFIFIAWALYENNKHKNTFKTQQMIDEEKQLKRSIIKGMAFMVLGLLFVFIAMMFPYTNQDFINNKIAQYYTPEQIVEQNIHCVNQRNQLVLSNGTILPQEDFNDFDRYVTIHRWFPFLICFVIVYKIMCIIIDKKYK